MVELQVAGGLSQAVPPLVLICHNTKLLLGEKMSVCHHFRAPVLMLQSRKNLKSFKVKTYMGDDEKRFFV